MQGERILKSRYEAIGISYMILTEQRYTVNSKINGTPPPKMCLLAYFKATFATAKI